MKTQKQVGKEEKKKDRPLFIEKGPEKHLRTEVGVIAEVKKMFFAGDAGEPP